MTTTASFRTINTAPANRALSPLSSDLQARRAVRTSRDRPWLHGMGKNVVLQASAEPDEHKYAPEADGIIETCGRARRARRAARVSRERPWLRGMRRNFDWDVPVKPEEQTPTPAAEWFVAPNPWGHYFLNFLLKTIENCIHGVAQHTLGKKLANLEWKQDKLDLSECSRHAYLYSTSRFINKDWTNPDTVEVEHWIFFFDRIHYEMPKGVLAGLLPNSMISTVLASAHEKLRQAAMHRQGTLTMDDLFDVMRIPEILQDHQRAAEVRQVFKVVRGDPMVDEHSRSVIENLILSPNKPPSTTLLEVHTKIESLQEEACFRYWRRELSEGGPENDRESPENVDLRDRNNDWHYAQFYPDFELGEKIFDVPELDGRLFSNRGLRRQVLDIARNLRNAVAHRHSLDRESLRHWALNGILLALLVDEREVAIMIEAVAEAFLTGTSLDLVLERLRQASVHDCPLRRNAIVRVCFWEESKDDLAKRIFYARKRVKGNSSKLKRFMSDEQKIGESSVSEEIPLCRRIETYINYDSVIEVFVITDTMHGALNSEERAYDWYDRSAAVAIAAAKYKVASQETEIPHKDETIYEEQTIYEEDTIHEEETIYEVEINLEAEGSETDTSETERGKEDEYGMTNTLDGTTLDYEDTVPNGPEYSSPILFLFFLIVLATKFHKLEIREGKRRAPPVAEETVFAPVKWRREETLEEARARVDEIIESLARIAIFEEMPCQGYYAQDWHVYNWGEWGIERSDAFPEEEWVE